MVTKQEQQSRVRNHKAAKGNVEISDVAADGKWLILQNTGRKDEILDGWKLTRTVDGRMMAQFVIPKLTLGPDKLTKTVRIWAHGQRGPDSQPSDLEIAESSWGVGLHCVTMLYSVQGDVSLSHLCFLLVFFHSGFTSIILLCFVKERATHSTEVVVSK